jgi:hypothetical protein
MALIVGVRSIRPLPKIHYREIWGNRLLGHPTREVVKATRVPLVIAYTMTMGQMTSTCVAHFYTMGGTPKNLAVVIFHHNIHVILTSMFITTRLPPNPQGQPLDPLGTSIVVIVQFTIHVHDLTIDH